MRKFFLGSVSGAILLGLLSNAGWDGIKWSYQFAMERKYSSHADSITWQYAGSSVDTSPTTPLNKKKRHKSEMPATHVQLAQLRQELGESYHGDLGGDAYHGDLGDDAYHGDLGSLNL